MRNSGERDCTVIDFNAWCDLGLAADHTAATVHLAPYPAHADLGLRCCSPDLRDHTELRFFYEGSHQSSWLRYWTVAN